MLVSSAVPLSCGGTAHSINPLSAQPAKLCPLETGWQYIVQCVLMRMWLWGVFIITRLCVSCV